MDIIIAVKAKLIGLIVLASSHYGWVVWTH